MKKTVNQTVPIQDRTRGRLLTVSGTLLFLGSLFPSWKSSTGPEDEGGWWILLGLAMFVAGGTMIIRGKQHLTEIRDWKWVIAQPSPIIYLRSFDSESSDYGFVRYFKEAFGALSGKVTAYGVSRWMPTFQGQLAMLMNRVGTYVAVGRPDAELPGLGAVRCYLDDDWEHRVREVLTACTLTVLRAGTTQGLGVEIALCRQVLRPQQLLMILPPGKREHEAVRSLLADQYDIELPKRGRALMLRFEEEWKAVPLTPRFGLSRTLKPFYLANGIEPPKGRLLDSFRLLLS